MLFKDSKISTKVQSGRTKTQAIVDNVLASTDGSNFGNIKVFPVLVQYFDIEKGIQHKLIELASVNETSQTITDVLLGGIVGKISPVG